MLASLESISCSLGGACPGRGTAALAAVGTAPDSGVGRIAGGIAGEPSAAFSGGSSAMVVGTAAMASSGVGTGAGAGVATGVVVAVEGGVMSSVSGSLAVSAAVGRAAVTDVGAATTVPSSSFSSPVLVTAVAGLLLSGDSVTIGSAVGPSERGSFSSSLADGAVGVAAAALTLILTSVAASLFDSASSRTDPGRLSVVILSVGLCEITNN